MIGKEPSSSKKPQIWRISHARGLRRGKGPAWRSANRKKKEHPDKVRRKRASTLHSGKTDPTHHIKLTRMIWGGSRLRYERDKRKEEKIEEQIK